MFLFHGEQLEGSVFFGFYYVHLVKMDLFDKAYSNLGKLWTAMWDNKAKPEKKSLRGQPLGRRAVSGSRLERYTEAFIVRG